MVGKDVTLLARKDHYTYLKSHGLVLINEFPRKKITEHVNVVDPLKQEDNYELVIVIMRKNSIKTLLPMLAKNPNIQHFLFMGNNTLGFEEYVKHLPKEKIVFGFPGGDGSRTEHIVHYNDSNKPN